MVSAPGKKRFNLHLNQKNAEAVREFLKDTGLSMSDYVDMLFMLTVENIEDSRGMERIGPEELFNILRVREIYSDMQDRGLEEAIKEDPDLAITLVKHGAGFSERYLKRQRKKK